MDTLERNQKAFGDQVRGFSVEGDTYADAESLEWMVESIPLDSNSRVLDVATGTGEFARAIAPHVASVIGIDATPAMLDRGRAFIEQKGISNIELMSGIAQELPFEDDRFDLVTSRYAFHHFADPKPVLAEMARVCRPGGHVAVVDIVVPIGSEAASYNYYEWLCDPAHTRCLETQEFEACFPLFGLTVASTRTRPLEEEVLEWMDFSLTPAANRERLLEALESELAGGRATGLSPHRVDSTLCFTQQDLAIVGRKA